MFLTIVFLFSTVQIIFQLPSLWYRYKVSIQMASPRSELGLEVVDPVHVFNQYNLPLSESSGESIWQMMVQWGVYFCFSWFITWRLKLSDIDTEELHHVNDILCFKTLFHSLISSGCSLTYGQYVAHSICYKYRTTTRQKLIYLISSAMSTLCIICILLGWQTAITDFGIGDKIYQESSFGLVDQAILIIAFLLITPYLYKYMVLPTSNSRFSAVGINTPSFLHGLMMQCFVFSFYLGLTALISSYVHEWGPELVPSLPQIGFDVSGNETFHSIDPAGFTPANAYQGDPINNRLGGIICSCIGIPLAWAGSYIGLYLYFDNDACLIQFAPPFQVWRIFAFPLYIHSNI
jgi:hypothetical protein